MPTLTALKKQLKDPQRLNVYVDGRYSFSLDLETAISHRLKPGLTLSDELIRQLVGQAEINRIWENLQKYCALRPRSESELNQWFTRKQVPEPIVTQLREKLYRLDLINDIKFARWWIEQRQTFRPRGAQALKFELQAKGVSSTIINQLLNDLPDQTENLMLLAERKLRTLTRFPLPKQREKIQAFLLRKGYTYSQIKPVIDELFKKTYT